MRVDSINEKKVSVIEYSAYEELALQQMHVIREEIFAKYELTCMHVYHSLGSVKVGDIYLFVFASSTLRRAAIDACNEMVGRINTELPVWGKELLEDQTHQWKINQ